MRLTLPGLFDLQVNGFGGIDFNGTDLTPDLVIEALERMRATGVTRCLPTLIPGTSYLAGSSLTLDRAIANTVRFTGLPIETVMPMASTIPASCLGMTPAETVTADWDPETCDLRVCSLAP